jgi:hypothetical protein
MSVDADQARQGEAQVLGQKARGAGGDRVDDPPEIGQQKAHPPGRGAAAHPADALAEKVVSQRFTFHDLRAHYATQHKRALGALPDLHADPGTTARVYERSRESRRKAL